MVGEILLAGGGELGACGVLLAIAAPGELGASMPVGEARSCSRVAASSRRRERAGGERWLAELADLREGGALLVAAEVGGPGGAPRGGERGRWSLGEQRGVRPRRSTRAGRARGPVQPLADRA